MYENVSDEYRVALRPTLAAPERETEPNDAPPLGNTVAVGGTLRGRLAFAKDRDLVCAPPTATRVRFRVEDAVERPRSRHSVLEVTSRGGPDHGIPVRVPAPAAAVKATARDAVGTFSALT